MFDPTQFIMNASPLAVAAAIIFAAFISEDAATLAAATLAATRTIEPKLAFASSVAGILLGDLGLYGLAYRYGEALLEKPWGRRMAKPNSVQKGREWFQRKGGLALFLSRCLPGTRLPISLAAGTFRMRPSRFAAVGAAGAFAWVGFNFALVHYSQTRLQSVVQITPARGLLIGSVFFVTMLVAQWAWHRASPLVRRWSRWEFWPSWLFYIPVVGMWFWLGIRHRGFCLPAIANPGQQNGGLVGESKVQILTDLTRVAPEFVAEGFLIPGGDFNERISRVSRILVQRKLSFPLVIKPDVGQRGAGFRKVFCFEQVQEYLRQVTSPVIVQRYVEGPKEIGVFYVRMPGEPRGEIFAITEKRFPVVTGNGKYTLEELIRSDERACMIASTYLRRFENAHEMVIPAGTQLRLVEAGNHCQGCIFADGMHLYSEPLRTRIDEISRALPEFYVGRYDIRYASDDELRRGEGFQIIELNGAASEATSIYDSRNSLVTAYKVLHEQWSLVFEVAARNRARGYRPPSLFDLHRDWASYIRTSARYPLAD